MELVIEFLQLFFSTFIYYTAAIISTEVLDYTENSIRSSNVKEISSVVLVLQIVLRLALNGFLINHIPHIFMYFNNGLLKKDVIFKTAMIYSTTNITFDSNLLSKVAELKHRIQ